MDTTSKQNKQYETKKQDKTDK